VANGTEKRIYRLCAMCGVFTALALVIPRLVPVPGYIQAYREISFLPRLAGIGPSLVLVTTLVLLIGFLRY
jgi:hypothetical protein